jgi:hypothetical protein
MLNMPPLKQMQTASAEKISGVAIDPTHAGASFAVVAASQMAP